MYKIVLYSLLLFFLGCSSQTTQDQTQQVNSFRVLKSSPLSEPIAINQTISLSFSSPLQSESITNDSLYVVDKDNNIVGARKSVDGDLKKIEFLFYEYLKPSSTYTIIVTTDLKDEQDRALSKRYTQSFETADTEVDNLPFVVRTTKPANFEKYIDVTTDIVVDFSKYISTQASTNDEIYLKVLNQSTSEVISGTLSVFNNLLKFTPLSSLPFDTNISVELVKKPKDLYSNELDENLSWSFKTGLESHALKSEGFESLTSVDLGTTAIAMQTLQTCSAIDSYLVVATQNSLELLKIPKTVHAIKPTIYKEVTLTIPYTVKSMVIIKNKYIVVGTLKKGFYTYTFEDGAFKQIGHYLDEKSVYAFYVGQNGDNEEDILYSVSPNDGLDLFDINLTNGVLNHKLHKDNEVVGIALDVVDAIAFDNQQQERVRKIYIADYSGKLRVLDKDANLLVATDINGSVKKLAFSEDNYGKTGIYALSSSGKMQGLGFDGTIYSTVHQNFSGSPVDVTSYVTEMFAYLYYSNLDSGIVVSYGNSSSYKIKPTGTTLCSSMVVSSNMQTPFIVTLSQSGVVEVFNALHDKEGVQLNTTSPQNEETIRGSDSLTVVLGDYYIDTTTIDLNSIKILNSDNQAIEYTMSYQSENIVMGVELRLTPNQVLQEGEYTLVISGNISDMFGKKFNNGIDESIVFYVEGGE